MTSLARRSAALATCMFIATLSVATGPEAHASGPVAAAGTTPSNSTSYSTLPTKFALTISPTRLVIGQNEAAAPHRILVVNRGEAAVPVTVQKRDFVGSPDGTLSFQKVAPYSASTWVDVEPTTFLLAPGTSQAVTATVRVPAQPEPGDHQLALVFLVPAGQTSANVKINRGVATPVYITVAGPTDNSAAVSDLAGPGFASGGPVTLTAKMHDTGTVHRDFRGATALQVGSSTSSFPDFTVLRGSTRDISTTWDPPLMCICHPSVSVTDADGTVHTSTIRVIVFPLPQALILLGALLLLALAFVLLRRRFRAHVVDLATAMSRTAGSGDA